MGFSRQEYWSGVPLEYSKTENRDKMREVKQQKIQVLEVPERENSKKEINYTPIKHVRAFDMLKCIKRHIRICQNLRIDY